MKLLLALGILGGIMFFGGDTSYSNYPNYPVRCMYDIDSDGIKDELGAVSIESCEYLQSR